MFRVFQLNNISIYLSVIACAVLLNGCVASNVKFIPPLTAELSLPSEGILSATIISAGGIALPYNNLTITPKNLRENADQKYLRLESIKGVPGSSSLFVSSVPEGEYALTNIRAFYTNGSGWISRFRSAKPEFGTFKVEKGKVTDLGILIYYPKSQDDKYVPTLLRVPAPKSMSAVYEKYNAHFKSNEHSSLSWNEDGYEGDRHSDYIAAAQNPVYFPVEHLGQRGSLFFLGKLGVFVSRDKDKNWTTHAVDTLFDLNAIEEVGDKGLIVGGDYGSLYYRESAELEWLDISLEPGYTIEKILSNESQVTVLAHARGAVHVMQIDQSELNSPLIAGQSKKWKTVRIFSRLHGWMDGDRQVLLPSVRANESTKQEHKVSSLRIHEFRGDNYIFIGTQSINGQAIFAPIKSYTYEADLDSWDMKKSKGYDKGIDYITSAGALSFGIKAPGFWLSYSSYFLFDESTEKWQAMKMQIDYCPSLKSRVTKCEKEGKRIRRYQKFELVGTPVFFDSNHGVAIVKKPETYDQTTPSKPYIVESKDGAKTWQVTNRIPPKEYCTDSVANVFDTWLVGCNGASSDFYESKDQGKTWEHVREHSNL